MTISIPDNEENVKNCICPSCPTYINSSLTGTLFCARGKAKESVKVFLALALHVQYLASMDLSSNTIAFLEKPLRLDRRKKTAGIFSEILRSSFKLRNLFRIQR